MKNSVGIYKILNLVTGDFYIGQSIELNKRWLMHLHYLRHGTHFNRHLQFSFNKYGEENFKFEVILHSEEFELLYYEQKLVDKLKPTFNIQLECVNTRKGLKHTEETKLKLSKLSKGRVHSRESVERTRNAHIGSHRSDETRKRMSELQKGKPAHNKGIPMSEEQKIKISETKKKYFETHKGFIQSEESNKKRSESLKKYYGLKREQDKLVKIGNSESS